MTDRLSRRELGLLLRAIDDDDPRAQEMLRQLPSPRDHARVYGFTGMPGAGKSTLVDGVIGELRSLGWTVAVLAVDPTSPFSGGAILGDRVRMVTHAQDDGVFIRSLATRGALGGLTMSTGRCIEALLGAGYDRVLVETVGVGQDEVDVVKAVDVNAVVCVPGLGDSVQAIKAGVLEIADLLVVNKADREGADRLHKELTASLHLGDPPAWGYPDILRTVATEFEGVGKLVSALEAWFDFEGRSHLLEERRRKRFHDRVLTTFEAAVLTEMHRRVDVHGMACSAAPKSSPEEVARQAVEMALCEGLPGVE